MSRHEGVSCDSCLKGNFRGRRYKCLVCYDYDLCAACYENGVTTTRHSNTHPMQCILTREDHELFYGGEAPALGPPSMSVSGGGGSGHHGGHALDSTQSYTCPFCAKLGFSEKALGEHVASQHADASQEVVCPICASLPGGDPNHVTDDFSDHLSMEHRSGGVGGGTGSRDLISFLDSPGGAGLGRGTSRQVGSRNVPRSSRGVGRSRRAANVHNPMPPSSAFSTLSPSAASLAVGGREPVDPIAELLSQLSGVRRSTTSSGGLGTSSTSSSSQLQQLQMQMLERQQARAHRQEALAAGAAASRTRSSFVSGLGGNLAPISSANSPAASMLGAQHPQQLVSDWPASASQRAATDPSVGQFLLRQNSDEELDDHADMGSSRQNRSQFVQDLVLSTLMMRRAQLKESQKSSESSGPLAEGTGQQTLSNDQTSKLRPEASKSSQPS